MEGGTGGNSWRRYIQLGLLIILIVLIYLICNSKGGGPGQLSPQNQLKLLKSYYDSNQYNRVTLKNGVEVLVVQTAEFNSIVNITMEVGNGYKNDPLKVNGISHIIEHSFFKINSRGRGGTIDRMVNDLGGDSNAVTQNDNTIYFINFNVKSLKSILKALGDIIENFGVDE